MSSTQGLVPAVSQSVPWEARRHINLLYQKLNNMHKAIGVLSDKIGTGSTQAAAATGAAGAPSHVTTVGKYKGIPGRLGRGGPARVLGTPAPMVVTSGVGPLPAPVSVQPRFAYTEVTGDYTAQVSDFQINCVVSAITVLLPAAAGIAGRVFSIKNSSGGSVIVDSTETIDGSAFRSLAPTGNLMVMSTGTEWIILSAY